MLKRLALAGLCVLFITAAAAAAQDGGYNATSELWVKAVLQVSGNPVTLVWEEVGSDTTPSGDKVVSGYFYADPSDFAYGSQYNPEVFVKIYIASSGWANIAFNHVTVDDVIVSSAHNYSGAANQTGTATLNNRLVEHQYTGVDSGHNDPTQESPPIGDGLEGKLGVWEGEGQQEGMSWTIKITLTEDEYLIEYPSLECGGTLTLLEEEDDRLLFRETITYGGATATEAGCCDKGFVELIDQDTNSLIYQWYSHDGNNNKGDLLGIGAVTRSE